VAEPNDARRTWLVCLALVLITLALYWPTHRHDFVQYDDPEYVSENVIVQQGITGYGLMWCFVDAHVSNWHPITWISHMIDCQFFGVNPGAHHLVNVAFHCANSTLLFLLLRTMTGAFWRSAFVAALFAWHPLRVESVAWISERKDLLSGFFFMLTLLAYSRYVRCQAAGPKSPLQCAIGNGQSSIQGTKLSRPQVLLRALGFLSSPHQSYLLTLLIFTLGLLSKAMLVTVPFVLLLLDYWPLNRFRLTLSSSPPGDFERTASLSTVQRSHVPTFPRVPFAVLGPLLIEKIPFLLLSLAIGVITFFAQRSAGAVVSLRAEGLASRMGNTLTGYFAYLQKIFWPHDLTFLYLRCDTLSIPSILCASIVLVAISLIAILNLGSRPYLVVGWLWFMGMLLPVSPFFQLGLQSIADRYTYLPAIGLCIMGVWWLRELAVHWWPGRAVQGTLATLGFASCLLCASLTAHQLVHWKNTATLMEYALQIDPNNYVAHQNLALYYSRLKLNDLASQHRNRVRELDPALRARVAAQ
jgi:hypothetical protein